MEWVLSKEWKRLWYGIYLQRKRKSRENREQKRTALFYVISIFLLTYQSLGLAMVRQQFDMCEHNEERDEHKRGYLPLDVDTFQWIHTHTHTQYHRIISSMMAIWPYVNVIIIWTSLLSTRHYSAQITYSIPSEFHATNNDTCVWMICSTFDGARTTCW